MKIAELESLEIVPARLSKVVALTGAGISAESGIPTFRGTDGYWNRFRPEDLATPSAFAAQPKLVWDWYLFRRELIASSAPNPGHHALVELAAILRQDFTLITQNVDGLHQRAGSANLLELHGNIFNNRCDDCARRFPDEALDFQSLPPACPNCRGAIRPDVVWFGESLNISVIEDAFSLARQASLFLSIGTSSVVHPAASLPLVALESGALLIEVNPDSTPVSSDAHVALKYSSVQVLPALVEKIRRVHLGLC